MTILLPVLIFFAVLLTPLYPVYAQDSTTSAKPPTLKERLDLQRSKLNTRIDKPSLSLRDNVASREAQLKVKRDLLKTKLKSFKDQRKATIVERINTDLDAINKRRTANMTAVLDMLTKIVEKVEGKIQESTASEENKLKIYEQIAKTKTSIEDAKGAVATQSAKEYTIKISSESAARADAKVSRDALHTDLMATHLKVKAVRDLVVELIKSYRQLLIGGVTSGN